MPALLQLRTQVSPALMPMLMLMLMLMLMVLAISFRLAARALGWRLVQVLALGQEQQHLLPLQQLAHPPLGTAARQLARLC
jgi:hypothetical protein